MMVRQFGLAPAAETIRLEDKSVGLDGVIVIHSSAQGPAMGGCRLWDYMDVGDMLTDASRLAAAMSYKCALAGLPMGGGKAVLRLPNRPFDRSALFQAFGRAVEQLRGQYVTAQDVGSHVVDMEEVARSTRHVAGLPAQRRGAELMAGGDPSVMTAQGVMAALAAGAQHVFGTSELRGMRVAVQGTGKVGGEICRRLVDAGAVVVMGDMAPGRRDRLAAVLKTRVVAAEKLAAEDVDIFMPCALGGTLDERTVEALRAKLVCGAANNQLESDEAAAALLARGIAYVPDYLANAGGVMSVAGEYLGESADQVAARVAAIGPRTAGVLAEAQRRGVSPAVVADERAEAVLAQSAAGQRRAAARVAA